MSDRLVHMTGRSGTASSGLGVIADMDPSGRLRSILKMRSIMANPVFSVGHSCKAVCFSETTDASLLGAVSEGTYQPFGIAFKKEVVFAQGGGPVHYVRGDEWSETVDSIPVNLRFRCARYWPLAGSPGGSAAERRSDFTWEREWRCAGSGDPTAFRFLLTDVEFLIVPNEEWMDILGDIPGVGDLRFKTFEPALPRSG
jgi:hypothetical protein